MTSYLMFKNDLIRRTKIRKLGANSGVVLKAKIITKLESPAEKILF